MSASSHAREIDILAIGESMLLVSPNPGERLTLESGFGISVAGAESNIATLLSRLGFTTAWLSRVGADPVGDLVVSGIAAHGVDTNWVIVDAGAPTGLFVKSPKAMGTEVVYYRRGSAASKLGPKDLGGVPSARAVVLSGITPALSPSAAELVAAVADARVLGGPAVVFDVNFRPGLWPNTEAARHALLATARRADVVFVGRDEAEVLWGATTAEDVRELLPHTPHLVVKDSHVEAVEFSADGVARRPSPRVDVVESVGAGDAFAGGWLAGWLRGLSADARIELGHASASGALQTAADIAPDVSPVAALLRELIASRPRAQERT